MVQEVPFNTELVGLGGSGLGGSNSIYSTPLGVILGCREEEAGRKSLKPAPTPCLTSILHSHTHTEALQGVGVGVLPGHY